MHRTGRRADRAGGRHGSDAATELSLETTFELLANERRRDVLGHLRERVAMPTDELVDRVAADEHGTTAEALTRSERRYTAASLHHADLPKLADAGLIQYDERTGVVVRTALAERVDDYLDLAGESTGA